MRGRKPLRVQKQQGVEHQVEIHNEPTAEDKNNGASSATVAIQPQVETSAVVDMEGICNLLCEQNKQLVIAQNEILTLKTQIKDVLIRLSQLNDNYVTYDAKINDVFGERSDRFDPKLIKLLYPRIVVDINKKYPLISYQHVQKKWPTKKKSARFLSILDEISEISWGEEFTLYRLNNRNTTQQLDGSSSNALFIESCWKGNLGDWEYAFISPGLKHKNAQNLLKNLDAANAKKLPVIFWNKEDPMHYDKFLPIAEKCDIILTTDSNKVPDYQRDLPNKVIKALPFAANPYICNPMNRYRYEEESICFAGSYYSVGHDDRKVQMDQLLPALLKYNGAIYDRMSKLDNPRYAFPSQYDKLVRDGVDFKTMTSLYKHFKIFLNVNTITDSPTMMSRRVYELLACGTPVISTPSLALEEQFKGIVQVASNAQEAVAIADHLLSNKWDYRHLSHIGYREVMLKHTYQHRVEPILSSLNISYQPSVDLVTVVIATMRPIYIDRIVENIARQNYTHIECVVVTQNYSNKAVGTLKRKLKALANLKSVNVLQNNSEATLGERLNQAAELAQGDYLAKFDDDDLYYENYLTDMLIPFSFGDFGLVGKREIFFYLEGSDKTVLRYQNEGHRETDFVSGATLVIKKTAFDQVGGFPSLNQSEDSTFIQKLKDNNILMYASDPFNFIAWRSAGSQNHTWQVDDQFFLEKGEVVGDGIATNIVNV